MFPLNAESFPAWLPAAARQERNRHDVGSDGYTEIGTAASGRRGAEHLVPGDIVAIEAGDIVPADGRLLKAATLTADEFVVTALVMLAAKGGIDARLR